LYDGEDWYWGCP